MMSTFGGGGGTPKADESTDKLRECDNDKEGGVQKSENFDEVICRGYSFSPSLACSPLLNSASLTV